MPNGPGTGGAGGARSEARFLWHDFSWHLSARKRRFEPVFRFPGHGGRQAPTARADDWSTHEGGQHDRRCHNSGWRPRHPVRRELIPASRRGTPSIRPATRIGGFGPAARRLLRWEQLAAASWPRETTMRHMGLAPRPLRWWRDHERPCDDGDEPNPGLQKPDPFDSPPRFPGRRIGTAGRSEADPGRHRRNHATSLFSTTGAGTCRSRRWSRPPRFANRARRAARPATAYHIGGSGPRGV